MIMINGVRVVPGSAQPTVERARVVLDGDGVVTDIEPVDGPPSDLTLVPAGVDLHLDNLRERRQPRATVELDHDSIIAALDAECAAAGIGTVAISARCEHSPESGVELHHAIEVVDAVEALADTLACDWRIHARVEVTDDSAVSTLAKVLDRTDRVALISMMEHSEERNRFADEASHRAFYAKDWGVSEDEVDAILASKRAGADGVDDRRRAVAGQASAAGIALASHDDRHVDDVDDAIGLGATVAEFPLTMTAAEHARSLGMTTVLGAPNVVRGRSTSSGNLLATDAIAAGACDILCSDYLPGALVEAVFTLEHTGLCPIGRAVDLIASAPAHAIGVPIPRIDVGLPLTASLRRAVNGRHLGLALWREGRQVFGRGGWADRS
jgi:alpha-D-ribose 1-methylphosphonate 5-triphosphate diphosphatase